MSTGSQVRALPTRISVGGAGGCSQQGRICKSFENSVNSQCETTKASANQYGLATSSRTSTPTKQKSSNTARPGSCSTGTEAQCCRDKSCAGGYDSGTGYEGGHLTGTHKPCGSDARSFHLRQSVYADGRATVHFPPPHKRYGSARLLASRSNASDSDDSANPEGQNGSPIDNIHCQYDGLVRQGIVVTAQRKRGKAYTLNWRINGPCSNVVRHAFRRAGYAKTSSSDACIIWGKHLRFEEFKQLLPYQKVNHFPGTYELGRKDSLYRNLVVQRRLFPTEFNFFPRSFILPGDYAELTKELDGLAHPRLYISKPLACARGIGIKVFESTDPPSQEKKCIVQRYLDDPFLVDGYKFDLRIYVVVTCLDPMRAYIYPEGLVRFCTEKYQPEGKANTKKYMHLTNFSLNKKRMNFVTNEDPDNDGEGSKWSLSALWRRLSADGYDSAAVWQRIRDICTKTLIAVEPKLYSYLKMHVPYEGSCFELYGFDVMLDSSLRPWLIEVNTSPSLNSSAPLDRKIKSVLVTELYELVGFHTVDRRALQRHSEQKHKSRLLRRAPCEGKKPRDHPQSKEKRRSARGARLSSLLTALSPEDINIIRDFEEEDARRGNFEVLFPAADAHLYTKYFQMQRYPNQLLSEWTGARASKRNTIVQSVRAACATAPSCGSN